MKKEVKAQVLEAIAAQIQQYPNFYITDIAGLNAEQTSSLRRECFEQGIKLTVVKNTLFKKALKDLNNSEVELLFPTLEGNTAIIDGDFAASRVEIGIRYADAAALGDAQRHYREARDIGPESDELL